MSKKLDKLVDINGLREFKNKLVGTDSAYVQTGAVDQTVAGTKTFSEPIVGSVTGSSGSCTGNAATATKLATARTIALSGAATGTATGFDGSGNITIPVTALDASKLTGTPSVSLVPAGVIIPFAGTSVPTGYLLCNGAAVSRTNYANLFAAIGTRYGVGNGSTTFNLPDARDRVLQGASGTHSVGSYIGAGLPNITGGIGNGGGFYCYSGGSRAFFVTPSFIGSAHNTGSGENLYGGFEFNAQRFNALYGASNTVQSPAIATNFIIKY